MKQIIIATLFTFVSAFGFANSNAEQLNRIEKLSGELTVLRTQLDETIQDKSKRTTTFLMSTTAAVVLGLVTATIHSRGSRDIGEGLINGVGTVAAGLGTITAVSIAGVNGFKVVMDIRAIPELQKNISSKVVELEAAKAVLSNAE